MMDGSQDTGVTWRRGSEVKRDRIEMEISLDRSAVSCMRGAASGAFGNPVTLACFGAICHTICLLQVESRR